VALGLALLLTSTACYEHTIEVGAGAPYAPVVYDHWENFWIGGLIGHVEIAVEEMCPSGDATIEARQTFLNGLVSALTGGIYTPTTLKVRCRRGGRADIELSADDIKLIVADERFLEWVREEIPDRLGAVRAARDRLADS
jgi:hypothetical protein